MKQIRRRTSQGICSCSLTQGNSPALARGSPAMCYYGHSQLWGDTLHLTPSPYSLTPRSLFVMQLRHPANRLAKSTGLLRAWAGRWRHTSTQSSGLQFRTLQLATVTEHAARAGFGHRNPCCWTDRTEKLSNPIAFELTSRVYITMSHRLFHFKYCLNLRGIVAIWLWWRKMWRNVFPGE